MRKSLSISLCCLMMLIGLEACHKTKPQIPTNRIDKNQLKEKMLVYNKLCLQEENKEITNYITDKQLQMEHSPLGFWYSINQKGDGPFIKKTQTVSISYSLELLNGTICEQSSKNQTKKFVVGAAQVEKGLDIAMPLFQKNTSATLIIPSYLAHGVKGDQKCIGSRMPILYHIKVINIK